MRRLWLGLVLVAAGLTAQETTKPPTPAFVFVPEDTRPDHPQLVVASAMDWSSGRLTLTVTSPIPKTEAVAPVARSLTADDIKDRLPAFLYQQLGRLNLDSSQTLAEAILARPELYRPFQDLASHLPADFSKVDGAYKNLTLQFSLNPYPALIPLFHPSPEANPIAAHLAWVPTRSFSGLVIFARGDLPLGGTNLISRASRALLPRLLNQDQEVILDASQVKPEFLRRWGTAGYSDSLLEDAFRDRIGYDPLRVVARAVYGRTPVDLVLSQTDTDKLLSDPINREFLAEGRVLIILDPIPAPTKEHP